MIYQHAFRPFINSSPTKYELAEWIQDLLLWQMTAVKEKSIINWRCLAAKRVTRIELAT